MAPGNGGDRAPKRARGGLRGAAGHVRTPVPNGSGASIKNSGDAISSGKYFIGSTHWIQHKEGFPCLAEIIEIRPRPAPPASPGSSTATTWQYYVHFCNFDKRLDEWVEETRFLTAALKDALWKQQSGSLPLSTSANRSGVLTERTLSRELRRAFDSTNSSSGHHMLFADPKIAQLEREHEQVTKVKNIQLIQLGCYEIDCWYFSPYPDEYSLEDKLYICERCLKYMRHPSTLIRHQQACDHWKPPGRLIYMKSNTAVFEIDGAEDKLYCQNLCLMAKLFLDHKTLYYDVGPFLFYVVYELDEAGTHPAGYFSKEKESLDEYNLACIMILPPYQRKGYGRFLIQLSYELTRREGRTGSPEKPLSDLGAVSYKSFWLNELLLFMKSLPATTKQVTIEEIERRTAFKREDILDVLAPLDLVKVLPHRDSAIIYNNRDSIAKHLAPFEGKKMTRLDPAFLEWP